MCGSVEPLESIYKEFRYSRAAGVIFRLTGLILGAFWSHFGELWGVFLGMLGSLYSKVARQAPKDAGMPPHLATKVARGAPKGALSRCMGAPRPRRNRPLAVFGPPKMAFEKNDGPLWGGSGARCTFFHK